MNTNSNYYPSLTGIRAIAAWMVFVHHNRFFDSSNTGKMLDIFTSEFHVGVTIFFVLSGFLIADRYLFLEKIDFRKYLVNRFARIFPIYFLLTTFTFAITAICNSYYSINSFAVYILNITFLKGLFDDLKFSGISQSWSLTVEEMFYFSAPFLFFYLKKSKHFLFLIPISSIIFGLILVFFFQEFNLKGFFANINFMLDFTFFGRIFEFIIGIALAIFINKKIKLSFKFYTFFGLFFIIISILILVNLKPVVGGFGTDVISGKIINTIFLPIFGIAPLFFGLIYEKTILAKLLSSKLFQILGKSSYVFYLIHIGIFASAIEELDISIFLKFTILNVVSVILYLLIEKPLNKLIRNSNQTNK